MVNRLIVFEKDKLYHIYNRGRNKQQLFFMHRDYERFLENLHKFQKSCPNIEIFAWCLIPNHFHFLLIEKSRDQDQDQDTYPKDTYPKAKQISKFMQKLQQAYAAFFNAKYGESVKKGLKGPVFEGRFKAKAVEDEDYLYHLRRYIEWNAVKHEMVDKPEEWLYSSYVPGPYCEESLPEDILFSDFEFEL